MPDKKWNIERLSSGERSALRRCAGVMMGSDLQAAEAFYHALNGHCPHGKENIWFAAMCMECLWRAEDHPGVRPFPEMARKIYQDPNATDSLKKRCTAYMDLNWAEDGFLLGKLCSLIRIMRSKDASIKPDFEQMADDLSQWNHADRYIQRAWLRKICMAYDNNTDEPNKEEHTNAD